MESLGGIKVREFFDSENAHCIVKVYEIDVNQSIINNSITYEPIVEHITLGSFL